MAASNGSKRFHDGQFWVTADRDIDDRVKKGDAVLIDPELGPAPGKHVLVNGKLAVWDGASDVDGCAVGIFYPEDAANG